MPPKASAMANRNAGRGRSFHSSHASSVTSSGAQFASRVAAAIDVSSSDQCHNSRSPAKNTPAQMNSGSRSVARGALAPRRSSHAHTARNGSASAPRQKAVAVGPVSDRRTKIPELPIASAPPNSASSARSSEREMRLIMVYIAGLGAS